MCIFAGEKNLLIVSLKIYISLYVANIMDEGGDLCQCDYLNLFMKKLPISDTT